MVHEFSTDFLVTELMAKKFSRELLINEAVTSGESVFMLAAGSEMSETSKNLETANAASGKKSRSGLTPRAAELKNKLKDNMPELSDNFLNAVVELANKVHCSPENLLALMYQESGGWNPASANKDKKGKVQYGGLIQMNSDSLRMVSEKYSKELGLKKNITMSDYLKLSREKQLKYAEGYMRMMKDSCNLANKKHLTGGEAWGMIKSPHQTKKRNQEFLRKLDRKLDYVKKQIFKPKPQQRNLGKG